MTPTLLHIDASPRNDGRSHSRRLTARFVQARRPGGRVVYRDLKAQTPPHVDQAWIEAAFAPEERRTPGMRGALAVSEMLIDEFLAADEYLLGVPMYNFGVPSALKAWIDNVVRAGRTFAFDANDPHGQFYRRLVPPGRRMTVVVTTGDAGYEPGGAMWPLNHVEPHLRTLFGFIGVNDLNFIYAGNDEFGGERLERSLDAAARRIEEQAAA